MVDCSMLVTKSKVLHLILVINWHQECVCQLVIAVIMLHSNHPQKPQYHMTIHTYSYMCLGSTLGWLVCFLTMAGIAPISWGYLDIDCSRQTLTGVTAVHRLCFICSSSSSRLPSIVLKAVAEVQERTNGNS